MKLILTLSYKGNLCTTENTENYSRMTLNTTYTRPNSPPCTKLYTLIDISPLSISIFIIRVSVIFLEKLTKMWQNAILLC